mmetsp:Transcript_13848/g.37612  ORF Transcript_13848/g.37612 Transcript_13848/m.37612 type:complete len:149 (+) Transcript_13848:1279-1725(+)
MAACVGDGVIKGYPWDWERIRGRVAAAGDGDGGIEASGAGCVWTEAAIALCKKPCGWLMSAGAVMIIDLAPEADAMPEGVSPDGTSMKVFFTGNGWPLFVTPSGCCCPAFLKRSSERGAGRLDGIPGALGGNQVLTQQRKPHEASAGC